MTLAMDSPVRDWMAWETASAANTMVRWASIASRIRLNMGRASRSLLDIRKRLLDVPEVVVFRNDLGGRHHGDRNVGYIALSPTRDCARPGWLRRGRGPHRWF